MNNDSGEFPDDAAAQRERSAQIPSEDTDPDLWAECIASAASVAHVLLNEVNVPGRLPDSGQTFTQLNDSSTPPVTINNLHLYGDFHMNTSGLRSALPSASDVRNLSSARNELAVERSFTPSQPQQQSVPGFNSTNPTFSQQLTQLIMLQHGVRQPGTAPPLYYFPPTSLADQNGQYGNRQIQQHQMHPNYSSVTHYPLEGVLHGTLEEVDVSVACLNQLTTSGNFNAMTGTPSPPSTNNKSMIKNGEKRGNLEEDFLDRIKRRRQFEPRPASPEQAAHRNPNGMPFPQEINEQPQATFMSEKQRGKQPERNQVPLVSPYQPPRGYHPYSAIQRGPPRSILDQMIHSPGGLVPQEYNCPIPSQQIPYLSPPWDISSVDNENGKEQKRSGGGPTRTNKKKRITKKKKEPQGLTEEEKARVKIMAETLRNNPGWDAGADDFDVQEHSYKDNGTPNRPSNAWMLYTKKRRQMMKAFFPQGERTGVMSAILSNLYHSRSNDMKAFHDGRAKDHRDDLFHQHPEYKYTKKSKKEKKKVEDDNLDDTEEDDMGDNPEEDEDNGNA